MRVSRINPQTLPDLHLLRCPLSGEPLSWSGDALVSGARAYRVERCAAGAYVDFRLTDRADPERDRQRAVYEAEDNRYLHQGSEDAARFLREFVDKRVRGRVRGKDRLFREAFAQLELTASARVLEIGCNDGRYLDWICAAYRCLGSGIDLSERAVERALRGAAGAFDTTFHLAESGALPFAASAFDAIVSLDVFEHLGHGGFARTMRECARVLRPGGRLAAYVVSQKDRYTFHETLRVMTHDRMGVDDGEGHAFENFIAPDHFRREARAAGLQVEWVRAYHGFWTLFVEEALGVPLPGIGYRLLEWLDRPLTAHEYGNGYLAIARKPA